MSTSTSSAGASDSGIGRCWGGGGGTSDLERLTSAALLQEVESRRFREQGLRKSSARVVILP
jgi:hypothetical protein